MHTNSLPNIKKQLLGALMVGLLAGAPNVALSQATQPAPEAQKKSSVHNPVETIKLSNGILIEHFVKGNGNAPLARDKVTVHYHGRLADGTVFDSSYQRGEPAAFYLNKVIKCWTEGVQRMNVGGKARIGCPPHVAYGKRGVPGSIPPDATLFFDVELLRVN